MDAPPPAAQPAPELPVSPGAILDGSQVLAHDGYDVDVWRRTVEAYGRLARVTEEAGARLTTALPLARDLFWSVHAAVPRVAPPAPLTPAHRVNEQLVREALGTTAWREARAAGTVGDPLTSAMATVGTLTRVLATLDDQTVDQVNELAGLERDLAALQAQADTLEELADQALADRGAALREQAEAARQQAQATGERLETVQQALAAGAEARGTAARRAARTGLAEAVAEIEATQAALAAFGGGAGVGPGGGGPALDLAAKLAIAQRVAAHPRLRQVAALAGRLTRIALQTQTSRVRHAPDEVASVTTSADLARALPSELALLADPATEDLFWLRLIERRLLTYELIGHERQGQGPIVLAIDNSGSMAGPKEVWSKAVMLALLAIAGRQRRDLAVLHFGGTPDELRLFRFPRGQSSPPELLDCASHFYGGGTLFEPWMAAALRLVDEAAFSKADVICLSDGLVAIDPGAQAAWQARRREREMRVYSLLIGTDEGAALLAGLSDALLTLDDLGADRAVLQTLFAI